MTKKCIKHCRQRFFNNVVLSEEVGRANRRRCYYIAFGSPPLGLNEGNTAASTFAMTKIVWKATKNKRNHRDGGWAYALKVYQYFLYVYVYVRECMHITIITHACVRVFFAALA